MGGRARNSMRELDAKVRRASPHKGPWPRVQLWHGGADRTVVPGNADAIALQWASLHGLKPQPSREDEIEGHPRRIWADEDGRPVIEQYMIAGMAHGVPLDPGTGDGESGKAGAHMLDVGLSSTDRIAAFFGIAPAAAEGAARQPNAPRARPAARRASTARPEPAARPNADNGVQEVIEQALGVAGMMR